MTGPNITRVQNIDVPPPYYTAPTEQNLINNMLSSEVLQMVLNKLGDYQSLYSTVKVCHRWRDETLTNTRHMNSAFVRRLIEFLEKLDAARKPHEKRYANLIQQIRKLRSDSPIWTCASLNSIPAFARKSRSDIGRTLTVLSFEELESLAEASNKANNVMLNWLFCAVGYCKHYVKALEMTDTTQKCNTLLMTAIGFSQIQYYREAVQVAMAIPDFLTRIATFRTIIKEMNTYYPEGLIPILKMIPVDDGFREDVMEEVLNAILEGDYNLINFDKAIRVAEMKSDNIRGRLSRSKDYNFKHISAKLTLAKQYDRALDIANFIVDIPLKEDAIRNIVYYLLDAGYFDKAENLAKTLPLESRQILVGQIASYREFRESLLQQHKKVCIKGVNRS